MGYVEKIGRVDRLIMLKFTFFLTCTKVRCSERCSLVYMCVEAEEAMEVDELLREVDRMEDDGGWVTSDQDQEDELILRLCAVDATDSGN